MTQSTTAPSAPPHPAPGGAGAARPRYSRRHYLIDPVMQGRYFISMLIIALVMAGGVALLFSHSFLAATRGGVAVNETLGRAWLLRAALGVAVMSVALLPIASIFLSHRIAGPAYRLRKAAAGAAAGELQGRIHLRRYDHLKSTAEAFNQMLDCLEERERLAGENRAAARAAIRAALEKLASPDELDFPEALRLLEEAETRLR